MPSSAASRTRQFRDITPPEREADVLRVAIGLMRERLPASWAVDFEPATSADPGVDAVVRLRAPDGKAAVALVQAKRLLNTRDVPMALEPLRRAASRWGADQEVVPILAARYLAPSTRERIAEAGAGY